MATHDLNDDCWNRVLSYIAPFSINELLKCASLNRRFSTLVDNHATWPLLCHKVITPSTLKSTKQKTWKSLYLQKGGSTCERCFKRRSMKQPLVLYSRTHPIRIAACGKCYRKLQPLEDDLFHLDKKTALLRELQKHTIFAGRNLNELLEEWIKQPGYPAEWLQYSSFKDSASTVASMLAKREERNALRAARMERRGLARERYADVAYVDRVVKWIENGVGDIDEIAGDVRRRSSGGAGTS
ncbi:hypothetical protein HK097_005241 [Rhizophlyctis rosea]|uniref:F-box domain-containing protein n=1 Tax=Rhizophlyctis rosea TaxID=64517 RepID=A0AAD5X2J5_9FUNG|nr:hypothetical protein HK097_005241 [Rhizophlyctis rosea]